MTVESSSFEGYTVVEKIDSGPLTDLYRATQTVLGRPVWIKALNPNLLPTSPFAQSLEREAILLSSLQHVNIVELYDFRKTAQSMWLVLEHVEGWRLSDLARLLGVTTPAFAVGVMSQLVTGLAHAHARGIVHRALRPECILLSRNGEVKLTGFGQAFSSRMPSAPELIDSEAGFSGASYLSPEQVLGETVDARSDLFSVGVILYELLTGVRPFDGSDARTTAQRIRHEAPAPLVRSKAQVPASLERTILRCLQKLASDRFASASELLDALALSRSEFGELSANDAILRELERAQLIKPGLDASTEAKSPVPRLRNASSRIVQHAVAVFGASFALIVLGGVYLQLTYDKRPGMHSDPSNQIVPQSERAHVRVVVDPWAYVYVDGVRFDVTPFAEAIAVSPGTHYFRFEHPNAPSERREVTLVPGETVLLDVKMKVVVPVPVKSAPLLPGVIPRVADAGP